MIIYSHTAETMRTKKGIPLKLLQKKWHMYMQTHTHAQTQFTYTWSNFNPIFGKRD